MKKEKGFIPVMLMPFKDNGAIDYDGLTRLVEFYLEAGASGLFANCLSSEMFELTKPEMLASVKHVVEVANGKVPVVATGTFKDSIQGQADFIKQIHDTGTDAVITTTCLLAEEHESDDQFDENVFQLLNLTGNVPLGFYECPVPYKRVLKPEQLARFVNTGRVIYHKDTSLSLESVAAKNKACSGAKNFGLYDAYMVHAVDSLKVGSAGLSCIQGNYFPELIVWLCKNYNNPYELEGMQQVQEFLIANMDVMHTEYPTVAKYFLQRRGMKISTLSRKSKEVLTPQVRLNIDKLYEEYAALRSTLSLKEPAVI